MLRAAALALSTLATLSSAAITLLPEQRVSPIAPLTRAPETQYRPSVAPVRDGFVTVWTDYRSQIGVATPASLYAAHIDRDGTVAPTTGSRIAEGANALIASNGDGCVVAYSAVDGVYTRRVDDAAHGAGDPIAVSPDETDSGSSPLALSPNGSGYVLVFTSRSGAQWILLDASGQPVTPPHALPLSAVTSVTTRDGRGHVIYVKSECPEAGPCSSTVFDLVVNDRTLATSTHVLLPPMAPVGMLAAGSSGDRIFVLASGLGYTVQRLFDSNDLPLTDLRSYAFTDIGQASVGWDGSKFLIALLTQGTFTGMRVSATGEPIDAAPFGIDPMEHPRPDSFAVEPAQAFGNGGAALVYAAFVNGRPFDVYTHVTRDFDDLPGQPATLVSRAPARERSAAASQLGGSRITVWTENDGNGSIAASVGGNRLVLSEENETVQHDPDVAAIGELALVVWRSDTNARRRVLGVRVRGDGAVLDGTPIVIDDTTVGLHLERDRVSVATNGHEFFVGWSGGIGGGNVIARRVSAAGTPLEEPAAVAQTEYYAAAAVKVVWTGTMYVIAYGAEDDYYLGRPIAPRTRIYVARVTAGGVPLDATHVNTIYDAQGDWPGLSAAAWGDRVVVVWGDLPAGLDGVSYVHAVELSASAPMVPSSHEIIYRGDRPSFRVVGIDMAVRAGRFTVAWTVGLQTGRGELHAALLDSGESFLADNDAIGVAVTPTSDGFAFTYSKVDPAAAYVPQLFTRELVLPAPRPRAVR
jgi:hypothetical protein